MSAYRKDKFTDLYKTKDWSDCTFIIDDQKIPAHKFLLACSSPVFETMFYGELASTEILIEDIDLDVFLKTLEYLYTDKLKIDSVIDAWNLTYVSQKYFLLELQTRCTQYIESNLSINNLLVSYEYSMLYNQKILLEKCLEDILMFTKGVLLFSNYHMQARTLSEILKGCRGNMTDLVMLSISWGLEECSVQGLSPSKENIYELLKKFGIINELRFKEFKFYFTKSMLKSLSKEQVYVLESIVDLARQFYIDYLQYAPVFGGKSLNEKSKNLQFKYRTDYKDSLNLRIIYNELLSPTVYCNKDCLIFGIVVSTKSQPIHVRCNDYIGGANIYIYAKHKNNLSHLIFEYEEQHNFLQYSDMQKIVFPVPVLFEAHKEYMICIEYISELERGESILLKYMSDKLYKSKNDTTVIQFIDEGNGSVLRGLCFYEV